MRTLFLLLFTGLLLAQAPKPAASNYKTAGTLNDFMKAVMLPAANVIFDGGNEPPKDDKGWVAIQNAALVVTEAGNLLQIGTRVKDRGNWIKYAKNLVATGEKTYKVALTKNADALLDVGGELVEACDTCHRPYRDIPRENAEKAKGKSK